jgi:hypothetical protein
VTGPRDAGNRVPATPLQTGSMTVEGVCYNPEVNGRTGAA